MTVLYDFKENINKEEIKECANGIIKGKVVVFPTETVYGIGANAFSDNAVKKIFAAKGRPNDNPLIVHISDKKMLCKVAQKLNKTEEKLANAFWPGPFTIILRKKKILPNSVTCGLNTVGVRMPKDDIAISLIKEARVPIAAPSANISGKPSGTRVIDIIDELNDKVDYIIDGGNSNIGVESTVVKVIKDTVVILRPGKISPEDIKKLGLNVTLDSHIFEETTLNEKVESPGMKHKHYSPNTNTILVLDDDNMIQKINETIAKNSGRIICVIGFNEDKCKINAKEYISIGSKNDLLEISSNIFSALRKLDKLNVDMCLIEGVKKEGIGIAIMNRLIRACGYKLL